VQLSLPARSLDVRCADVRSRPSGRFQRLLKILASVGLLVTGSCRLLQHKTQEPTPQPIPVAAAPRAQPQPEPPRSKPPKAPPLSPSEKGIGANGIPLYLARGYSPDERELLRSAFGIAAPQRLYFSDSSDAAILKYDVRLKLCRTCRVDTYRVGFLSMRRREETWEQFEGRMQEQRLKPRAAASRRLFASLHDLDPDAESAFAALLEAGRRAGFKLTVLETYRTPEDEARMLAEGVGRTYTATSLHSYGRAADIRVDDGNLSRASTRANWIRFRKFVTQQANGAFRLVGNPDNTWDWPHIELPAPEIGFHSVDDALEFGRRCLTDSARANAPSAERLGGATSDPCVVVPNLTFGMTTRRTSRK